MTGDSYLLSPMEEEKPGRLKFQSENSCSMVKVEESSYEEIGKSANVRCAKSVHFYRLFFVNHAPGLILRQQSSEQRIFLWTCTMKPGQGIPDVAVMPSIAHNVDLYYRNKPCSVPSDV